VASACIMRVAPAGTGRASEPTLAPLGLVSVYTGWARTLVRLASALVYIVIAGSITTGIGSVIKPGSKEPCRLSPAWLECAIGLGATLRAPGPLVAGRKGSCVRSPAAPPFRESAVWVKHSPTLLIYTGAPHL
jgi:hypothetical protein